MPTAKTISHIGDTKFELIKDTYDSFRFTVDDKSPLALDPPASNSPKTVMYISSQPVSTAVPTPLSATGRVTMSNIRSEGTMSTSVADVDTDISIGGKILIREGIGINTATRAAIYAQKDPSAGLNHRLIIDPYKEDDGTGGASANNGTVYIRGSLIVEGNKTILDTAEHITSENLIGINAVRSTDSNGDPIIAGGAATTAGIHVYSAGNNTQFLYDFDATRWLTGASIAALKDLQAKNLYATDLDATGTSTLTTVDIAGGNIDGTAIGATIASAAKFTSLDATGTSTLTTVDIAGGNIDGTAIGATIASAAKFTSLDATGTSTLTTVDIAGGNIDGTAIGATIASAASFTTITASTNLTARDVNAVTFGNIVQVDLGDGGPREDVKTVTTNHSAPLHGDILHHFALKTFAAGQCVVALTDGTNASVAMFSFSKCGGTLTLVLDQEVHSSVAALSVDYDSSGTIDLILGTATSATYCVKVLPVMTSDSIAGPF